MDSTPELLLLIEKSPLLIGYNPMGDEPDPNDYFKEQNIGKGFGFMVSQDKDIDPIACAHTVREMNMSDAPLVFIPGREFDSRGTRHGRGGGWYDRFISSLPASWVRIGVASAERVHDEFLKRNEWDEEMDFLLIHGEKWSVRKVGTHHTR